MWSKWTVVLLLAALGGCYSLSIADGSLGCSASGKPCPDDYFCDRPSNTCFKNGHVPPGGPLDLSADGDAGTDGGPVALRESDCLDGLDNNGDGLVDCADPTCADRVACVAAVAATDDVGTFGPTNCPLEYTTVRAEHQGLSSPTCSGCACTSASVTCAMSTHLYSDNTTCTNGSKDFSSTQNLTSSLLGAAAQCVVVPQAVPLTYFNSDTVTFSRIAATCAGGSATVADPVWTTSSSFCAASRSSASCGDTTHVCVAKLPIGAAQCVRLSGAGASCPGDYPTAKGTWYGDFDKATCSACTCTVGSQCTAPSASLTNYYSGNTTCDNTQNKTDLPPSSCTNLGGRVINSLLFSVAVPTCTSSATTTPAAPTLPSTICCQ